MTKATGHRTRCVKQLCSGLIFPNIHHLFTISLSRQIILEEWRINLVVPFRKSGNKSEVSNYRPISLLCVVSKILEHLVYVKTIDFVIRLISFNQFGFLPGRSALQQLLTTTTSILNAFERNNLMTCIYLDFKKAFDTVPHTELLPDRTTTIQN